MQWIISGKYYLKLSSLSVMTAVEKALDLAKTHRRRALDAAAVRDHLELLSQAVAFAFAAWATTELMLARVPAEQWPSGMTREKLSGYSAVAEEGVVRGQIALGVGCINTTTRAALDRHIAGVKARGPAWADELIDEYWYYPRSARGLLLGQTQAT